LIFTRAGLTIPTEQKHLDWANEANMYNEFFALRENPFNVNPDPRFLFLTPPIQDALGSLTRGIESRKGLILLTGEVGTGKTTLLNRLLDWLRERRTPTAFIFNSHLEISHLFDFVLADFGVKFDPRLKDNALMRLHQWLLERYRAGDTPVLIVDEAQGLRNHVLEEIRLLLNLETASEKLLQIVLAGQPELEERFQQLELRPIKQRIALRCKTAALTPAETRDYIQARLRIAGAAGQQIFAPPAMDAVHFYSGGIPRVMNLLCEHALINASVERIRPVPVQFVAEVAREFQFDGIKPVGPPFASSDGLDSDATRVQSRFMNALVSLTAMDGPLCPERADAPTIPGSVWFADADNLSTPVETAAPPALDSQSFPEVGEHVESSRPPDDQLAAAGSPWLRQLEARLLSDWTTYFSEVGGSLASESAVNPAPVTDAPRLHLVEAKGAPGLSPASSRGQVSNRQAPPRPPSKAVARKSVPPNSSSTRLARVRVSVVRWRTKLSDRFSSTLTSGVGSRTTAILIQLSGRWLHAVRARYWEFLAWGDRGMNIVGSIDWPRLRMSAFQWLREPCDPTRWRLPDSRVFAELLRFNHKKT
jgi:general secretion pathway protein A